MQWYPRAMSPLTLLTVTTLLLGSSSLLADVNKAIADCESDCFEMNRYFKSSWGKASWPKLKELVTDNKITNSEDLEKQMRKDAAFQPFLHSLLFMDRSNSSVKSVVTPEWPRRILFEDGMILARSGHGDPKFKALNSVYEGFHYDFAKHQYTTFKIDFNKTPPGMVENPPQCIRCHGDTPRPNWPSYRNWPGAALSAQSHPALKAKGYESLSFPPSDDPDKDGPYQYFWNRAQKNGERLNTNYTRNMKIRTAEEPTWFGQYVNNLNLDRLAHQLTQLKDFELLKYAILGAVYKCDDLEDFFTAASTKSLGLVASERKKFVANTRDSLLKNAEAKEALAERFGTRVESAKHPHYRAELKDADRVGSLRWLVESRGLDVSSFSSDYIPMSGIPGYGFHISAEDEAGIQQVACYLLPAMAKGNPELARAMKRGVDRKLACAVLKEQSLAAQGVPIPGPVPASDPKEKSERGRGRSH